MTNLPSPDPSRLQRTNARSRERLRGGTRSARGGDRLKKAREARLKREIEESQRPAPTVTAPGGEIRELGGESYTPATAPQTEEYLALKERQQAIQGETTNLVGQVAAHWQAIQRFQKAIRALLCAIAHITIESAEDKGYILFRSEIPYRVIDVRVETLNDDGTVSGTYADATPNYAVGEKLPIETNFIVTLTGTSGERLRIQAEFRMVVF